MRGFTPEISWLESFLNRRHYLIILYMTTKRVSAPFDQSLVDLKKLSIQKKINFKKPAAKISGID